MAESTVADLIVRLLEFLGQSAAKNIAPYFGGGGKLDDLKLTMKMLGARLHDAERRQEAEDGALIREWLRQLKRVMCRLEDLLEELAIADEQDEPGASGRLTKVVCYLPSKFSSLKMNKTLLLEAQDIMRDLQRIKSNMKSFHFNEHFVNQQRMNMINTREETMSFIPEEEVIGRDEDKNEIRRMLLECHDVKKNLSVIFIVGMGGLGKTALAQLVFHDKQVEQHFELKSWACISDQIPNFRELVGKVFHSISKKEWQHLSLDHLQSSLREAVDGKRFLLVLEDVWLDNRDWWVRLEHLLRGGKQGSKILATTRTIAVASSMGTIQPYLLNNLPADKSWELFKRIAFNDQLEEPNEDFISIGKEIIKKCGNVPLAIRTIAGLLYSRNTVQEWMYFRDREIGTIEQTPTDIMPTLKISYHHLQPEQKQCFAYCALFQKAHCFDVPMLIRLWMAHGFVKSLDDGRICFMELLRRCFFQNLNVHMEMETCQMHDLMHDLAKMVGDECQLVDSPSEYVNENIRHVRIVNNSQTVLRSASLSNTPWHLRSYVEFGDYDPYGLPKSDFDGNISSLRRLRLLFLNEKCYESLPESVGELIHLRYLKVCVDAHYLPEGITKLRYLQLLDLEGSSSLRELPREFYRLTSLKHLRLGVAISLIDMPPRFGELTSLQSLDTLAVGENNGSDALSGMNLAESLVIYFKKQRESAVSEAAKANLKGKKLTVLYLNFEYDSVTEADELLEHLQPPSTLRFLRVDGWNGERFPQWGIHQLPNLVYLCIRNCKRCRNILPFSRLPHIKLLYVIDCEELDLWDVKDEDGDAGKGNSVNSSTWPCMKSLEFLSLSGVSKLQSLPSGIGGLTALRRLDIVYCDNLKTLPESIGSLFQLRSLVIHCCSKLEALPKSIQNLTALKSLEILSCPLLKTRCEEPDGDDWPLIQHIPHKHIS